jgi:hypothetical protein
LMKAYEKPSVKYRFYSYGDAMLILCKYGNNGFQGADPSHLSFHFYHSSAGLWLFGSR